MFAFDLTVTVPVLLSIGSIVFAWFRTRRIAVDGRFQEADARFKTGSDRMDRHESRIQSLEQTVKAIALWKGGVRLCPHCCHSLSLLDGQGGDRQNFIVRTNAFFLACMNQGVLW